MWEIDTGDGNMKMKILEDSTLGLEEIVKELDHKMTLDVGIDASADPKSIMKAIVNEYGYDSPGIPVTQAMRKWFAAQGFPLKASTRYIKIPARPFISKGIYDNLDEIWSTLDDLIKLVQEGKLRTPVAFNILGAFIVEKIQGYIDVNDAKANHPLTVQRKGFNNPLTNTGSLRDSIAYKVNKGGK